jgi:hypothetical protein|tara:strand:- start:682 stop:987 length:306 start_codon:yes stop_codon:yes gene_type:complete
MKEFKENDIISLKLVSGEEVIGKFKSKTADATTIEKALVMMHGPKGLAFGTFFATANSDNGIDILNDKLISIGLTNNKVKDEYARVTSSVVQPTKKTILTS